MYDPEKVFNFVYHYEISDNDLSVSSFGRELTEAEKKDIVKKNENSMKGMPKGHQVTTTLGTLAPLEDASEDSQSK